MTWERKAHFAAFFLALSALAGCKGQSVPSGARTSEADRQVRAKFGKGLDQLPVRKLVGISAHNENIQNEFAWAFSLWHAAEFGQRVDVEWRDVGGGGSQIARHLLNEFTNPGNKGTTGIDIFWGGGAQSFTALTDKGFLVPFDPGPEVRGCVPAEFLGVGMYDPQFRWFGSAVSGFGFVYNKELLRRFGIAPPATWDDLADRRFADLLVLTDAWQSGSAAAAYQMIAQSGDNWPDGWARLLRILANAKRFTNNAGTAASAPLIGESLAAACIDYFGTLRVAESKGELVYVSPAGQTAFTPDPIAILKNGPNPEVAKRFVTFVLSREGQAMLALRVGAADGPVRSPLGRQPIRQDVYKDYAAGFGPDLVNPYREKQAMALTKEKKEINFDVLRFLVRAAAVDNLAGLRAARDRLIATDYDKERLARFNALPPDALDARALKETAKLLKDAKAADRIATRWQTFFADKYRAVSR